MASSAGAMPAEPKTDGGQPVEPPQKQGDSGLCSLAMIAAHFRIATDPFQLAHDLGLGARFSVGEDIVRAAKKKSFPRSNHSKIVGGRGENKLWDGEIILVTRRFGGVGIDPATFGFRWFLPSLWRYRKPLAHVLIASLFIQLFALVTPLFFQVVIDKVLVHKGLATLVVIVIGLAAIGLFDVTLQYLRSYALSHTTSRIDVELGSRLFDHLLRLPLAYFETRPTGQTVARVRELETIRSFLTGQGLLSAIDLLFTVVFIAVLMAYSPKMTLIVILSFPVYLIIAILIRPALRAKINQRFNTGAASQQFLVESIVGIQTLKAAAVEPILRNEWEDRLAAYVKTSFQAVMLSSVGQNAIQYVSKATTALVLFFGAQAVINGEMTVGGLIAFNMIMNQVTAPILRLSQLWQDFQQVQISVQRLGDILNSAPESQRLASANLPPARARSRSATCHFATWPDTRRSPQEYQPRYSGRTGPRHRRTIGLGQIHADEAHPAALPRRAWADPDRRHRYRPGRHRVAAPPDRRGAAGEHAVQPLHPRQYRARQSRHAARPCHRGRAARRSRRVHLQAAARLRHADRGARRQPFGRPAAAHRDRPRALATQPRILIFDEATSALDYESERIIQDKHAADRARANCGHHCAPSCRGAKKMTEAGQPGGDLWKKGGRRKNLPPLKGVYTQCYGGIRQRMRTE